MTRIALPDDAISKLRSATEFVEICTTSGDVVGTYCPKQDLSEYDLECPTSPEELSRRSREETGRPLVDITNDWFWNASKVRKSVEANI